MNECDFVELRLTAHQRAAFFEVMSAGGCCLECVLELLASVLFRKQGECVSARVPIVHKCHHKGPLQRVIGVEPLLS